MRTLIKNLFDVLNWIYNYLNLKSNNVQFTFSNLKDIRGKLFVKSNGTLKFSSKVRINSRFRSNPIGGQSLTSFLVKDKAEIIIGEGTGISNSSFVAFRSIVIEKNVYIGGNCKIYDTDFHSLDPELRILPIDPDIQSKGIIIKDNAFIGSSSIILKGVTIGENSIVGAGSVVTKSIPSNEIWAGNPAKFIKKVPTRMTEYDNE